MIETIRSAVRRRPGTTLGIGDDAAILAGDPPTTLALDLLVEGVHFEPGADASDLGWKALAVNLSDLAAMGATPVAALVGLVLPPDVGFDVAAFYAGMERLAERHGVTVAGGDLSSGPCRTIAVCVSGALRDGPAFTRGDARAGDLIVVSGPLGRSEAGRLLDSPDTPVDLDRAAREALRDAHRRPRPRFDAVGTLRRHGVRAAMDCSDGLALDCRRMAEASGLAAEIDLTQLAPEPGVSRVARALGQEPDLFAVAAGEDYQLIAALPAERRDDLLADLPDARIVGRFVAGEGLSLHRGADRLQPDALGWEHDVG